MQTGLLVSVNIKVNPSLLSLFREEKLLYRLPTEIRLQYTYTKTHFRQTQWTPHKMYEKTRSIEDVIQ